MKLGLNVDHVATLRQARKVGYPSPCRAALMAQEAGVDNITVHLREDRRHIQDQDVLEIKHQVKIPLNFEMAATTEMQSIALELKPNVVTLVPEKREEITTEGGLLLERKKIDWFKGFVEALHEGGISEVSLFIDPKIESIHLAKAIGADSIELHTGQYSDVFLNHEPYDSELDQLKSAAKEAQSIGLKVHAGHGMTMQNVLPIAKISEIESLQIGHAIIAEAIFSGLKEVICKMKVLMRG